MDDRRIDKKEIEKYLPGMKDFIEHSISAEQFVFSFLNTRRNDNYLMTGQYSSDIEKMLDYLFSVVDRHAPAELYEDGDVNDEELIRVVRSKYLDLVRI